MHLGFLGYLRAWVSVETIQLLGMESLREGFWPGLCRLTCNIDWELVPFISSFLSPTITDLDLTLPHANNRLLQPTLSLLTHTCRQLRSLRMDVGTFDPLSCREMGRLISTSRHTLHHIDIRSPTPPDIFPAIFDLPQLQDLILQEPHVPYRVPLGILPRLRVISFNGKNGRNLQQFLRGLSMQSLAEVRISLGGTIQFSALLDPLCAATGTMNILCLSHVGTLDRPSITLLCSFTNIAHLKIDCVCPGDRLPRLCNVQLTDESILELGTALPHLHTLSFTPGCRAPCHVTFTSLIYLSRTCGDLEHLSIRVDFASILNGSEQLNRSSPSVRANSARPQRESSGLHSLVVGKSPLPDIPRREWVVALALVSIFPSIVSLRSWCAGEMSDKWKEVAGNIPICQEIFRITHPQAAGRRLSTQVW